MIKVASELVIILGNADSTHERPGTWAHAWEHIDVSPDSREIHVTFPCRKGTNVDPKGEGGDGDTGGEGGFGGDGGLGEGGEGGLGLGGLGLGLGGGGLGLGGSGDEIVHGQNTPLKIHLPPSLGCVLQSKILLEELPVVPQITSKAGLECALM
jgi:hypothetical protein